MAASYIFYYLLMLSMPAIPIIIVFSVKARNRRNFIERYGCTPEIFEQIKSYKELLDDGIISQQEFEAKKYEILTYGNRR